MELNGLEQIEHTTLSMVVQALTDYASDAQMIFREETDLPQDIAEDITGSSDFRGELLWGVGPSWVSRRRAVPGSGSW